MRTPQEFLDRIGAIIGADLNHGEVTLHFSCDTASEARAVILRIRTMQKELRLLKQEINYTVSTVKSEYATAVASVGSGIGSGLAAGFFGRKTVGKFNTAERDSLRRARVEAIAPYDNVKRILDGANAKLDYAKGQIQLSPEYRGEAVESQPQPSNVSRVLPPVIPPSLPPPVRYFVYLDDQVKGPYSSEQIAALHDVGTIWDETLCCLENTSEWKPYTTVFA